MVYLVMFGQHRCDTPLTNTERIVKQYMIGGGCGIVPLAAVWPAPASGRRVA